MNDLKELILDVTKLISSTKQALSSSEAGYHADQDRADDVNKDLKNRLTVLKEVRDKLESLL